MRDGEGLTLGDWYSNGKKKAITIRSITIRLGLPRETSLLPSGNCHYNKPPSPVSMALAPLKISFIIYASEEHNPPPSPGLNHDMGAGPWAQAAWRAVALGIVPVGADWSGCALVSSARGPPAAWLLRSCKLQMV